jgi:hypothetical protein
VTGAVPADSDTAATALAARVRGLPVLAGHEPGRSVLAGRGPGPSVPVGRATELRARVAHGLVALVPAPRNRWFLARAVSGVAARHRPVRAPVRRT